MKFELSSELKTEASNIRTLFNIPTGCVNGNWPIPILGRLSVHLQLARYVKFRYRHAVACVVLQAYLMPAMPSRGMIRLAFIAAVLATICVILIIVAFSFFPQIETMLSSESSDGANVIVVGGGLAGLSATVEAVQHGARVTIIEKEASVGGNSAKATSGMNGAGTAAQQSLDIKDSPEFLASDTMKSGSGLSKAQLVSILATNSANAVEFITSFEVGLTNVVQLGGHSIPRTHRIPPTKEGKPVPVGFTIISTLKKYVENNISGSVQVLTNSVFRNLLWDGDRVVGVVYKAKDGSEHELRGNVILTAGGFANDRTASDSLLAKYVPHLSKLPTTNGVWATGDIIKATADDGLSLVDMDQVQVHPTGFIEPSRPDAETKFLAPEALRGCGAILLDPSGRRFVNELDRRDHVTNAIFDHCSHYNNDSDLPVTSVMLMNEQVLHILCLRCAIICISVLFFLLFADNGRIYVSRF